MTVLAQAFLWPGNALCNLVGLHEEGASKHLLRLFLNLTIWSKIGVIIAMTWVDLGG